MVDGRERQVGVRNNYFLCAGLGTLCSRPTRAAERCLVFRTHCGAQVPDGSKFCTVCGATVVAASAPPDDIAHHAGYGDTGHDPLYGVEDESQNDKKGTKSIGSADADYQDHRTHAAA